MLTPIRKQRVSSIAVEQIQRLIATHQMKPGDSLPSERSLMEQLKVSRVSVREALRVLEMMGIVEVYPGKGLFVADRSKSLMQPLSDWLSLHREVLLEHFEVRLLIEPHAAGFAAKRATKKIIKEMRKTWVQFNESLAERDLIGMIRADASIHALIASATGNRTLEVLMNIFSSMLLEGWKASLRTEGRAEKTVEEHDAIIQAIEEGNEEMARTKMKEHLEHAVEDLRKSGLFGKTGTNCTS